MKVMRFLLGLSLGAGLALLFAPKSGRELRRQLAGGASRTLLPAAPDYYPQPDEVRVWDEPASPGLAEPASAAVAVVEVEPVEEPAPEQVWAYEAPSVAVEEVPEEAAFVPEPEEAAFVPEPEAPATAGWTPAEDVGESAAVEAFAVVEAGAAEPEAESLQEVDFSVQDLVSEDLAAGAAADTFTPPTSTEDLKERIARTRAAIESQLAQPFAGPGTEAGEEPATADSGPVVERLSDEAFEEAVAARLVAEEAAVQAADWDEVAAAAVEEAEVDEVVAEEAAVEALAVAALAEDAAEEAVVAMEVADLALAEAVGAEVAAEEAAREAEAAEAAARDAAERAATMDVIAAAAVVEAVEAEEAAEDALAAAALEEAVAEEAAAEAAVGQAWADEAVAEAIVAEEAAEDAAAVAAAEELVAEALVADEAASGDAAVEEPPKGAGEFVLTWDTSVADEEEADAVEEAGTATGPDAEELVFGPVFIPGDVAGLDEDEILPDEEAPVPAEPADMDAAAPPAADTVFGEEAPEPLASQDIPESPAVDVVEEPPADAVWAAAPTGPVFEERWADEEADAETPSPSGVLWESDYGERHPVVLEESLAEEPGVTGQAVDALSVAETATEPVAVEETLSDAPPTAETTVEVIAQEAPVDEISPPHDEIVAPVSERRWDEEPAPAEEAYVATQSEDDFGGAYAAAPPAAEEPYAPPYAPAPAEPQYAEAPPIAQPLPGPPAPGGAFGQVAAPAALPPQVPPPLAGVPASLTVFVPTPRAVEPAYAAPEPPVPAEPAPWEAEPAARETEPAPWQTAPASWEAEPATPAEPEPVLTPPSLSGEPSVWETVVEAPAVAEPSAEAPAYEEQVTTPSVQEPDDAPVAFAETPVVEAGGVAGSAGLEEPVVAQAWEEPVAAGGAVAAREEEPVVAEAAWSEEPAVAEEAAWSVEPAAAEAAWSEEPVVAEAAWSEEPVVAEAAWSEEPAIAETPREEVPVDSEAAGQPVAVAPAEEEVLVVPPEAVEEEPVAVAPAAEAVAEVQTETVVAPSAPEEAPGAESADALDQAEMRRRIEETRARLKAKAFDAMMSGESALLSRDKSGGTIPSGDDVQLDAETDSTIDESLSQEDY